MREISIAYQYQTHDFRFVDCNMLMHFHFCLGVGHIYSHYHGAPAGLQPELSTHDISDEDEGTSRVEAVGERFGDSNESLLEQFSDMYESDVDLDYEN